MPMAFDDGKWKYGVVGLFGLIIISCGFVLYNKSKKKYKQER